MNLLLDVGRSRLKLGLDGPGGVTLVGRFEAGDRAALRAALERLRPDATALHMADGGPDPDALARWLETVWGAPVSRIRAAAAGRGLRLHYERPETFGVDRLLALRAARARAGGACLVVDAGTAVTVDGLSADGAHCGGWIGPGYRLQRAALASLLELGPSPDAAPEEQVFAGTEQAVEAGIWRLLAGGIDRMCAELLSGPLPADAPVFGCGGDAERLADWCRTRWEPVPELVLEGLAGAARGTD